MDNRIQLKGDMQSSAYKRYWNIFREISYRLDIFRICRYEEHAGDRILIICNIWKLVHPACGHFRAYMREPGSLRWKILRFNKILTDEVRFDNSINFHNLRPRRMLPEIQLWPLYGIGDEDWMLKKITATAFLWCASAVRARMHITPDMERNVLNALHRYLFGRAFFRDDMPHVFFYKNLPGIGAKGKHRAGRIASGLVALRKAFWRQFRDVAIMSALKGIMGNRRLSLEQYACVASYAPGLLRVATERKNCLPLLTLVHPADWGRQDIFDKGECDGFHTCSEAFRQIKSASWRNWFLRQPQSLIRAVESSLRRCGRGEEEKQLAVIETLRNCGFSKPVSMLAFFVRNVWIPGLSETRSHELCRAFCSGMRRVMRQSGAKRFRPIFATDRFEGGDTYGVKDFIRNNPTALDRQHIEWTGLQALSEEWHFAGNGYDYEGNDGEHNWNVPYTPLRDDQYLFWAMPRKIKFKRRLFCELVTTDDLVSESYVMEHCAYTYAGLCMGGYRIFHFKGYDGKPYTLGISENGEMDQCFGFRNANPPKTELQAAVAFCRYLKTTI